MRIDRSFEVDEPDAVIELSIYGSTLAHIFIFGLDEPIQAGACVISNPRHVPISVALLEGAIDLLRKGDWQTVLDFDADQPIWKAADSKTPSNDGELRKGTGGIDNDIPF